MARWALVKSSPCCLRRITALGHEAIGLDGSGELSAMARANTDCEVPHQDFLALDLPSARFDGIFANASLFHVPSSQLARVLGDLAAKGTKPLNLPLRIAPRIGM